jgi:hypothetical protein
MPISTENRTKFEFTSSIDFGEQLREALRKTSKFYAVMMLRAFAQHISLRQAIDLWDAANADSAATSRRTYIAHAQAFKMVNDARKPVGLPLHLVVVAHTPVQGLDLVEAYLKKNAKNTVNEGYTYSVSRMQEVDPIEVQDLP